LARVSAGAKYGFRFGQISESRIDNDFVDSSAHLGVLRADLHIVKNWDAVVEGRVLYLPEAESTRYGAFAAVYRHFGDNLKLGVGYNFADFSDDLSDVTFDDEFPQNPLQNSQLLQQDTCRTLAIS